MSIFAIGQIVIHLRQDGTIDHYPNGKPVAYYVESSTPSYTTVRYDPNKYADITIRNTPHNPFLEKIKTDELVEIEEWEQASSATKQRVAFEERIAHGSSHFSNAADLGGA